MSRRSQLSSADTSRGDSNHIPPHTAVTLLDEAIPPGETRSIPITFSSSTAGTSDVLSLVTYSSADDPDLVAAARLAHVVTVLPILAISATARPAQAGPSAYLLGLTCANTSSLPLQLHHVDFVSPYWSSASTPSLSASILPNQSWRTFVSVDRGKPSLSFDQLWQRDVVSALGKLVDNREDFAPATPCPLPADVALNVDARAIYRLASLQACFPTIPTDRLSAIFPLVDPLDLDVTVSWSVASDAGQARTGRTALRGIRLAPAFSTVDDLRRQIDQAIAQGGKQTRTMYEETGRLRRALVDSVLEGVLAREDDPVAVRVVPLGAEQGKVHADFDRYVVHADDARRELISASLAPLPVRFELQNRSPAVGVRFVLALSRSADQDVVPRQAQFTGQLVHRGTIPPLTQHDIQSFIEVAEAGMLGLGAWQLDVETGVAEDGVWTPRRSWSRAGRGPVLDVVQKT